MSGTSTGRSVLVLYGTCTAYDIQVGTVVGSSVLVLVLVLVLAYFLYSYSSTVIGTMTVADFVTESMYSMYSYV